MWPGSSIQSYAGLAAQNITEQWVESFLTVRVWNDGAMKNHYQRFVTGFPNPLLSGSNAMVLQIKVAAAIGLSNGGARALAGPSPLIPRNGWNGELT